MPDLILTLACPDRVGIVYAVTGFLAARGCNVLDSQQFGDPVTGRFFMRVHVSAPHPRDRIADEFVEVADRFGFDWQLTDATARVRTLILVSRQDRCATDLLYRWRSGTLPIEVAGVISNHRGFETTARHYGVPFEHLPTDADSRTAAEERLLHLIDERGVELVVLARYMQILSPRVCDTLPWRIINIHHSFLPSFSGARPYHQAYARGVKLIGATAHYVTADLDEGPIIEQEVARVDHAYSPDRLAQLGSDLEAQALARAVRWHAEHRVLANGTKTVVFR